MASSLSMDEFLQSFEECTLSSLKSDAALGIDPDTIIDDSLPQSIKNHCMALQRNVPSEHGSIPVQDFLQHKNILVNIYENNGLVPLVLCTVIFEPRHSFSLEFDGAAFKTCWDLIKPQIPQDVIRQAKDYAEKSEIVLYVSRAEEKLLLPMPNASASTEGATAPQKKTSHRQSMMNMLRSAKRSLD